MAFLIDASTSRPKQVIDLIVQSKQVLQKLNPDSTEWNYTICVEAGTRLELLTAINEALTVNFGTCQVVMCCCSQKGTSKSRAVSWLAVACTAGNEKHLPFLLEINRSTSFNWEKLRFRCLDAKCPYRSSAATGMDPDDVHGEIGVEDRDCAADAGLEITEETSAADEFMEDGALTSAGFKRNIWVFARPLARYKVLLKEACRAEPWLMIGP